MNNNELMIFENEQFGQVRFIEVEGKQFAVANDVAKALGYADCPKAVRTHCKGVAKMSIPTNGGKQTVKIIPEGDIYRLIIKSKLPSAEKFESWVFDTVLVSIRETGGYIPVSESDDENMIMAKALLIAQKNIEKKDKLLKAQEQQINVLSEDLSNKNRFIKQLSASENSLLVREVAKVASKGNIIIGEKKLWAKLREWGLIFLNSTEPKQSGIDRGYLVVSEGTRECNGKVFTYRTTRVTGKGQAYIIKKLINEKENEQ